MNILITGNLGYVGSVLMKYLRQTMPNAYIEGYDTCFFCHQLTGVGSPPERNINRQSYGDTRDITINDLAKFDAVVHLAAVSNDPMGNEFESVTRQINEEASLSLAKKCVKVGVKHFVFASSCSMYGEASEKAKTEDDETAPLTAYARSKIGTELGLSEIDVGDMIVTNLRFATACGMSGRLRLDLVLNDFVASAIVKKQIEILSDGMPWRPLIDVNDMARAIYWAAFRPKQEGGQLLSVNVGKTDWNYQVKDIAMAVLDAVPDCELSINRHAPEDKRSYKVDFSLFEELAPDFVPRVSLEESVQGLLNGLNSIGFSNSNFRQSNLIRLIMLREHLKNKSLNSNLRWEC